MFLSVICQADSQSLILIVIMHIILLPKCSIKAHKTKMPKSTTPDCGHVKCMSSSTSC